METDNEFGKLVIDDTVYETILTDKYTGRKKYEPQDPKKVFAFIPGTIREIFIEPGKSINKGDPMLILEAMKMKNEILSDRDGVVRSVNAVKDQKVAKGELLIEFE